MAKKYSYTSEDDVVEVINEGGQADVLLICEHASNYIPADLENLGLSPEMLQKHIAWDPGALQVATILSDKLDAPLVASKISRLVYDCNRPPSSLGASPTKSELFDIPGNQNLDEHDRKWREENVYLPFKGKIEQLIEMLNKSGKTPVLFTIHSFTPIYHGKTREVEIGVIHAEDARLADLILAEESEFQTKRNEPYAVSDGVAHTLQTHGDANGLASVMIEIRNDLLASEKGINAVADYLGRVFGKILKNNEFQRD